jgi:hypothetical protein
MLCHVDAPSGLILGSPDMERKGSSTNASLARQLIRLEGVAGKYKSLRRYAAGHGFPLCFLLPELSRNCIHFQQQKV